MLCFAGSFFFFFFKGQAKSQLKVELAFLYHFENDTPNALSGILGALHFVLV